MSAGDEHELASLSPTLKRKRGESDASIDEIPHILTHEHHSPAVDSDDEGVVLELEDEDDLDDLAQHFVTTSDDDQLNMLCTPMEVRQKVREVGMTQFTADLIKKTGKTPQQLGMIFGLDADQIIDVEVYMLLLERVLVHALTRRRKLPQYNTIDDAARLLRESNNIMVITGAGISTSLGIPDFRSKQTGFYSKLQDMGFSEPEDVFDIHIFDDNPEIFYSLAGDILPSGKQFTPTHGFIRLLQDQRRLQTNYTQNIDNLEANAGIDAAKVIQCHGSFATATCRKCKHKVLGDAIFGDIRAKKVALCQECVKQIEASEDPSKPKGKKLKPSFDDDTDGEDDNIPTPGVMKPDITFFGEQLPDNFFERFLQQDSHAADLVIVIGTSLKVAPVADMPNHLPEHIPHIYISREACQHINFDIQLLGDCDTICWELARRAGWQLQHAMIQDNLETLIEAEEEGTKHKWNVSAQRKTTIEEKNA